MKTPEMSAHKNPIHIQKAFLNAQATPKTRTVSRLMVVVRKVLILIPDAPQQRQSRRKENT